MKRYVVEVQEGEQGEQILPLPEEMLKETGWKEGDTLNWKDNQDGTYTLTKVVKKEREFVLVEAISIFRQRYVLEVPKGKGAWADDTVTMNEALEFSQKHLGEEIVSRRVISRDEITEMFKEDNDYLSSWNTDRIIDTFVTVIDEDGNLVEKKE